MHPDSEVRQLRATAALDALQFLFESLPMGTDIPSEHVAALLHVTGAAVRETVRRPMIVTGINDTD